MVELSIDVPDLDSAPHKLLIGFGHDTILLMLVNDKVQGTFNRLCFRFGLEYPLRAPDFRGIELEVFVRSIP
jgi:hypothetical protein